MSARVVFEVEGSDMSVSMGSDTAEVKGDTTVFRLAYFELWELIAHLSDIKKEAER